MRAPKKASSNRIRQWLSWLWQQEGTPAQRARGLAAGVFCGCFPFFGLQILFSVGLASLVRGNHLLAAAGTWVSNPFTYIPLYWFNFQMGCRLMGPLESLPDFNAMTGADLWAQGWNFSSRLLLGSVLVASLTASAVALIALYLFRQRDPRKNPHTMKDNLLSG